MVIIVSVLTDIFRAHAVIHVRQSMDIKQASWIVVLVMMTVAYSRSCIVLVMILMLVEVRCM